MPDKIDSIPRAIEDSPGERTVAAIAGGPLFADRVRREMQPPRERQTKRADLLGGICGEDWVR